MSAVVCPATSPVKPAVFAGRCYLAARCFRCEREGASGTLSNLMDGDEAAIISGCAHALTGIEFHSPWMKVLALIAGLVLIAAVCFVVLIAPAPKAKMTINAVAATGGTFYKPPQQVWSFAITNRGPASVLFHAYTTVVGPLDKAFDEAGGFIDWPEGTLAPGKGITTNMLVPGMPGAVWRGEVMYWTGGNDGSYKVRNWLKRVPGLSRLIQRRSTVHFATEFLHTNSPTPILPGS